MAQKELKDELGNSANALKDITHYNNYYEFTTDKEGVASLAANFKTSPWEVAVSGLVDKPRTFSVDELEKLFHPEERIYRLRCVEAWSMVIPWLGFPLDVFPPRNPPRFQAGDTGGGNRIERKDNPSEIILSEAQCEEHPNQNIWSIIGYAKCRMGNNRECGL